MFLEKANYRNNIFKLGKLANISKTKITKNDLELEKIKLDVQNKIEFLKEIPLNK